MFLQLDNGCEFTVSGRDFYCEVVLWKAYEIDIARPGADLTLSIV